jgi:glycerol-3-phosphate dehydrogenase
VSTDEREVTVSATQPFHRSCVPVDRVMNVVDLSPATRDANLAAMQSKELDVLVVGGGVVGAGCALDATTRGLDTALVEAEDWASGTSSRSSKLIHGGLRYLEMMDFHLVREALRERGLLLDTVAPHLVRPVAFLYPLTHRVWERAYAGSGIALYDLMAKRSSGSASRHRHRHLSQRAALQLAPALRPQALIGAIEYFDAQVDDARFTMMLARTAATYGALVANRAKVTDLLRDGDRVTGARVTDRESGRSFEVRAKVVISATGVWSGETQALAEVENPLRVRTSKGVHIVVRKSRLRLSTGLILRTESSVLFVIPWNEFWIIGTTDTDYDEQKSDPRASAQDVEYLLSHLNEVLSTPLHRDDIVGVYAGLRPLLDGGADATAKLSREHTVSQPRAGLVVVAGGKFTTYRVMAKDAVDLAVEHFDRAIAPSHTSDVVLVGGENWTTTWNDRDQLALDFGLDVTSIERLLRRYGSLTSQVLELVARDRTLAMPFEGSSEYLKGEFHYAVTHEGALHIEDLLTRRTHVSIEAPDHGVAAARHVGEIIAPLLGWDADRLREEIETYDALVGEL